MDLDLPLSLDIDASGSSIKGAYGCIKSDFY